MNQIPLYACGRCGSTHTSHELGVRVAEHIGELESEWTSCLAQSVEAAIRGDATDEQWHDIDEFDLHALVELGQENKPVP